MNNSLDKWRPHADENRRKVEAALAIVRERQRAQASPAGGAEAGEILELSCVCAVYDKGYTLRFVRQASGLLRFSESVKHAGSGIPARAGDKPAGPAPGVTVPVDDFETTEAPCAWCGDESFHYCRRHCGALVCGGRMRDNTFHCRPSCGAEWVGVPLENVKATPERHEPSRPSCPAPARRALAGGDAKRLPAAEKPAGRFDLLRPGKDVQRK